MWARFLVPPVLVVVLAATACDVGGEADTEPEPARSAATGGSTKPADSGPGELACDEMIDVDVELPRSYETVLDAVALPTASSAGRALQVGRDGTRTHPVFFGKTGLVVRADEAFSIEVTKPASGALGWGSPADFGPRVTSAGCPGTGWIVFAGGFQVRAPTCVELVVVARGERDTSRSGWAPRVRASGRPSVSEAPS